MFSTPAGSRDESQRKVHTTSLEKRTISHVLDTFLAPLTMRKTGERTEGRAVSRFFSFFQGGWGLRIQNSSVQRTQASGRKGGVFT